MFRVLLTFAGGRYGGLIVSSVVADGMRLAARLGHPRASSAHVLCALLETDKQIHRADGASQRPDIVRRTNTAGDVLERYGLTSQRLILAAADQSIEPAIAFRRRAFFTGRPGARYWSENADVACSVAVQLARTLNHRMAGTSHLLVGCLDNPTGPASRMLNSLDVDPVHVLTVQRRRLFS